MELRRDRVLEIQILYGLDWDKFKASLILKYGREDFSRVNMHSFHEWVIK